MRFAYLESMCDPAEYVPLAQAAEAAGYDAYALPDSICYPETSDSKYPYTPDGNREFLDGKPFIDPMSLIPALAAVTTTLRFNTFVYKLAVREPVLAAKAASSVAVMTGNRFCFGVGLSPWPEDFAVCHQPWKGRGRRLDEMIEIVRGLTTPGYFEFHGEFYDVQSIKLDPVPSQPIPILIGGHSDAALHRAARIGDGWMHAGGDPAELDRHLARLAELRGEYGRENEPFELHVIHEDGFTLDGVRRLEDRGITDVLVGFRDAYNDAPGSQGLQQKIDLLRGYADSVIAKL